MTKLVAQLRSQWMGALSLFLVLAGGTAWAAAELSRNDVKSKHIGKGQVKNSDLAKDSVTSPKVANASLLREDFAPSQLPRGERGLQGPPGEKGEPGSAAGYMRVSHIAFRDSNPDAVVDSEGITINAPERSQGVMSVKRITASKVYCFDLAFTPEVAVGSAFVNNAAIVSTSVGRDYFGAPPGCPETHPDAKIIVYDAAGNARDDVSFGVIFEEASP